MPGEPGNKSFFEKVYRRRFSNKVAEFLRQKKQTPDFEEEEVPVQQSYAQ
jgi:hypothetical protein